MALVSVAARKLSYPKVQSGSRRLAPFAVLCIQIPRVPCGCIGIEMDIVLSVVLRPR